MYYMVDGRSWLDSIQEEIPSRLTSTLGQATILSGSWSVVRQWRTVIAYATMTVPSGHFLLSPFFDFSLSLFISQLTRWHAAVTFLRLINRLIVKKVIDRYIRLFSLLVAKVTI